MASQADGIQKQAKFKTEVEVKGLGSWSWSRMRTLFSKGLLVIHVLSKARPHTLEVGDVVTNLLDGTHLLLQVVTLQEVRHLQSHTFFLAIHYLSSHSEINCDVESVPRSHTRLTCKAHA